MGAPVAPLSAADVRRLADRAVEALRGTGRLAPELRREIETLDRDGVFTPGGRGALQDLLARLGMATAHPIGVPVNDEPFWFRLGHPLADHQSHPDLPEEADVVVIGAGLTGASAAYHLADSVNEQRRRVVVLEQGDPAGEASGRNGGNFELIPENSVGIYEGLARERYAFLRRRYPKLPVEVVHAESERQASVVLGLALRNRELFKGIILHERIDCDFAPRGWLHLASTEDEEQGMCEEVTLAAQHGQRIELWSRRKIRQEFGIENPYLGRFIPGDGTYHPFKYVCGLLRSALQAGVELYTRTPVREVVAFGDRHLVITDRGTISARALIVATNAYTSQLFPELSAIKPHQSQVQVTERAPDRARGRVVTCEDGPTFFNQPRAGVKDGRAPLLMGGGADRPMSSPSSRRRSPKVHAQLLALRDRFYPELRGCPPSAEWVGPMAFTPDQLPAIGFLRPGVIIAAGYNGYGGSYTTAAGMAAAQMALTGRTPDWVPEDVFSPRRLTSADPIFMTERDSLWRIAAALCRQLSHVNRQISEALTLSAVEVATAVPRQAPPRVSRMIRASDAINAASTRIDPALLAPFPAFRDFTTEELALLLDNVQRWDLPQGTLLFMEGDPGNTCFVLVRGGIDVSVKVRGRPQLLAQLSPGAIFGQASLVSGEPRSTSCSIHRDALLAEIHPDACERLLASGSPIALKLLAALNQGLVAALRTADRNLMRLDAQRAGDWTEPAINL